VKTDLIGTLRERYRRGMNPGRAFSLVYHRSSPASSAPGTERLETRHRQVFAELTQRLERHARLSAEATEQLGRAMEARFEELANKELRKAREEELLHPDERLITQGMAQQLVREQIERANRSIWEELRIYRQRNTEGVRLRLRADETYERMRGRG
jgi:hypothetical protein